MRIYFHPYQSWKICPDEEDNMCIIISVCLSHVHFHPLYTLPSLAIRILTGLKSSTSVDILSQNTVVCGSLFAMMFDAGSFRLMLSRLTHDMVTSQVRAATSRPTSRLCWTVRVVSGTRTLPTSRTTTGHCCWSSPCVWLTSCTATPEGCGSDNVLTYTYTLSTLSNLAFHASFS